MIVNKQMLRFQWLKLIKDEDDTSAGVVDIEGLYYKVLQTEVSVETGPPLPSPPTLHSLAVAYVNMPPVHCVIYMYVYAYSKASI